MSVEGPQSLKESTPRGPIGHLIEGIRQKVESFKSLVRNIQLDREIQKQGSALIAEARDLFRRKAEYNTEQWEVYIAASDYRSTERPMQIGAIFRAGEKRYNVRVTETQETDPLAMLMLVYNKGNTTEDPDERINVDLRRTASIQPRIAYWQREQSELVGAEEQSPEAQIAVATRNIKTTLIDLGEQITNDEKALL